jgi:uncharacterized membrane protein YgdD (TMEM256/DUF423 family)
MAWVETFFMAAAGLAGLGGVALSAAASHGPGGPVLDTAARFLLIHAAALLGLAALLSSGAVAVTLGRLAGGALLLGLVLFCGDLIARTYLGRALFPLAAPTGGILLMAGWGLVTVAALVRLAR